MGRRFASTLVVLLVLATAACSGGGPATEVPEATAALRVLAGTVEVQPPSAEFSLAVDGQTVEEGFTIRTGADGRAAIEYFDGSITRLDENTTFTIVTLRILDNDDQSKVIEGEQSEGSTYSRVTTLTDSASRFEVTTPTATASVQGTVYALYFNPDGSTGVVVFEGSVVVSSVPVGAGFMVTAFADGTTSDPVPIPDDLVFSDWIVFNCEEDGGIVDDEGNCVLGTGAVTTTVVAGPDTTSAGTTTTSADPATTTTTVATPVPAVVTTTTTTAPPTTTTTAPPTTTTTEPPTTTTTTEPPTTTTTTTAPPTTTTTTAPPTTTTTTAPPTTTTTTTAPPTTTTTTTAPPTTTTTTTPATTTTTEPPATTTTTEPPATTTTTAPPATTTTTAPANPPPGCEGWPWWLWWLCTLLGG